MRIAIVSGILAMLAYYLGFYLGSFQHFHKENKHYVLDKDIVFIEAIFIPSKDPSRNTIIFHKGTKFLFKDGTSFNNKGG